MLKTANSYTVDDPEDFCRQNPECYLEVALEHSPILNRVVGEYGEASLKDYLSKLRPNEEGGYQDREDLIDIVYQYTKRLLGDVVALQTAKDFSENPIVLTANHHGVDYFSHSFQASLLFSLYRQLHANSMRTVPVLACGNIPLDNATYPQGMFFYAVPHGQLGRLPMRLPVFPNRLRRQLVSSAQPFDSDMVERAEKRLAKMVQEAQIASVLREAAGSILSVDYRRSWVVDQSCYSDQAVLLNNLIWKRVFHSDRQPVELVYLELEKIVEQVLQIDLRNPNSLIYQVMFEPALRESVLHELDGARACWDLHALKRRSLFGQLNDAGQIGGNGSGTLFFWGVNEGGRRIPLFLTSSGDQCFSFIGIDDHRHTWQLSCTPEAILAALSEGRLLPSLFSCFLVLALARGVRCIGSYFQGEYLPNMQKGLVNALNQIPGYHEIARRVETIKPNFYLSGMLPVMTLVDNDFIVPAGPVEILAGGGLTDDDIEKILSIKVRDAHVASLLETLPDFMPALLKSYDWKARIAKDSLRRLEGKVVIK
jgi:hypothetical protein